MAACSSEGLERRFARLKREVHQAAARLVQARSSPMTRAGLWAPSDIDEVWEALHLLGAARCRHVADLGSGDGRVVLTASLLTQATGLEASRSMVDHSRGLAARLNLPRASFKQTSFWEEDLGQYDLIYTFPDKPLDGLSQRLPPDWPGRLVVYGGRFLPANLHCQRHLMVGATYCTIWTKLAGD